MRELFPIEAKRAEPSVSRSVPPPASSRRPTPALVAAAAEGIAEQMVGLEPEVPPDAFSVSASSRTVLSGGTTRNEASHRTPVTRTPITRSPVESPAPLSPSLAERLQQLRAAAVARVAGHRIPAAVAATGVLLLVGVGVTWTVTRRSTSPGTASSTAAREPARPDDTALNLTPKLEPPPPPPPGLPAPSSEPGTLTLTVIPWGAVYVDGKL